MSILIRDTHQVEAKGVPYRIGSFKAGDTLPIGFMGVPEALLPSI